MDIEFQKSVVVGKVYQSVCIQCESRYFRHPSESLFWSEYVLNAETKKDMKVKVEEHIMKYHVGEQQ